MKKEFLMILVLIGLPTLFIMNLGPQSTGAIVNELAQIRVEHINLAMNFPNYASPPYKVFVYRIRLYLRSMAREDYYYPYGLTNGNGYYLDMLNVVPDLHRLACLRPYEDHYISASGRAILIPWNRWAEVEFEDLGQIPCNPELAQAAEETLDKLVELNNRLLEITIQNSNCPENSADSMALAEENVAKGNYEAAITNWRSAWSKVTYCT
jgi:hypothetical protein